MSRRGLRQLGTGVLGGMLLATTLTACSKEADGAVAVGQDADGEVVVQIVTCEYPATELSLLLEQDGEPDPYEDLAAAPLDQAPGTSQTYSLDELFGESQVSALDAAAPYHLRGTVTDDDGARDMNGVSFTPDEVAEFVPGEVIGSDLDVPVSPEAFAAQACEDEVPSSEKPD